jgi:hypothetical protein
MVAAFYVGLDAHTSSNQPLAEEVHLLQTRGRHITGPQSHVGDIAASFIGTVNGQWHEQAMSCLPRGAPGLETTIKP